jgi:hypothetical protein
LGNHRWQAQHCRLGVGLLQRRHARGCRWIVDAHKDDGKRYIVESDELLSAFLEVGKDFAVILRAALLLFVGMVSVLDCRVRIANRSLFSPDVSSAIVNHHNY